MIALLDGDLFAYRCAATAENDVEEAAISRMDELIKRVLQEINTQEYECYLGGRGNWRKEIYPDYKANRKDKPPPKHLDACNAYLRQYYNAVSEDGLEGDDLLSIRQHQCLELGVDSIIASIDKDMFTVPGWHYQWEIGGTSVNGNQWSKPAIRTFISPLQGLRRFYGQVISGDGADNVPAFDGKLRSSVPKFVQALIDPLNEMDTEEEMYSYCVDVYMSSAAGSLAMLNDNASVLYMLKKRGEMWKPPTNS